jgi:hypothetical protein
MHSAWQGIPEVSMQIIIITLLAAHAAAAAAPEQLPVELAPAVPQAPTVLTDEVIKKAVREVIAEDPHPAVVANREAGAFRADPVAARMTAAFEQAKVPDCLHQDALKLQPASIGPINVVGPYSLPWVISAAMRGKCR